VPAVDHPLSHCPNDVSDFRDLLPHHYNAMPQRGDDLPAAGHRMSEFQHRLPLSANLLPDNGNDVPGFPHPMSCGRDSMPRGPHPLSAAGDGLCATGAGSNMLDNHFGICGLERRHRGGTCLRGNRCGMSITDGEDRQELIPARARDAIDLAQWYNAGRPNNIGRPFFYLCVGSPQRAIEW